MNDNLNEAFLNRFYARQELKKIDLEDAKYYNFLNIVLTGKQIKRLKQNYFKNPPTQQECNETFKEFEQKVFRNRIIICENHRLLVYSDSVVFCDLLGNVLNTWHGEINGLIVKKIKAELKEVTK